MHRFLSLKTPPNANIVFHLVSKDRAPVHLTDTSAPHAEIMSIKLYLYVCLIANTIPNIEYSGTRFARPSTTGTPHHCRPCQRKNHSDPEPSHFQRSLSLIAANGDRHKNKCSMNHLLTMSWKLLVRPRFPCNTHGRHYSHKCRSFAPSTPQSLGSKGRPGEHQQHQQHTAGHRCISTKVAKKILGFASKEKPTMRELRKAYFDAAKKTHPDLLQVQQQQHHEQQQTSNGKSDEPILAPDADDFRRVTEAYERLLGSREIENDINWKISSEEEEEYRQACMAVLGVPAEIVEESKRNPMFRHWLGGNTDGAQHWRSFFAVHGGLAQKLQVPAAYLDSGGVEAPAFASRRPRRR